MKMFQVGFSGSQLYIYIYYIYDIMIQIVYIIY